MGARCTEAHLTLTSSLSGVSALAATGVRGMRWASHPEAMALGPGGEFLYFTVANAKSTRHGEPSPETTMLAGVMSRCITHEPPRSRRPPQRLGGASICSAEARPPCYRMA